MASAAPNSNTVLMDFFQQLLSSNQPPNHALVPVESLTSSPSSSTGSGSILDWNSNSDAELLDSDLDFLPPSIVPHSPMKCSLPTPPAFGTSPGSTPSTTASAPPSTSSHGSQPDSDSDSWTSLFGGLMPPAPIGGLDNSATSTVPESGNGAMPTASNVFSSRQMSDLDKMCDQFESRVWVGDYPTFAPRKLVVDDEEKDNGDLSSTTEPELETSASGVEGDMSSTNTIVPTQLVGAPSMEAPTTSTPTAAISTLTAPSPQNPWISSGLFQALDEVSPVSSNPQGVAAEIISIAEYFHRKALSAEESPANRTTPTPEASTQAEATIRPDSANSDLSYFTGPRSVPSSPPAISATLATDDVDAAGNSNNNPIFTEDEGSAPTTVLGSLAIPPTPPIVEAKNDDVALSSSTPSEEPSAFQREVTESINLSREAFLQNFLNRSNSYPAAPRQEPTPTTVDPANLSASTQSAFQRLLDSSLTRSPPRRDSPGLFGPRTPRSSSPQESEDLEEDGSLTRSPGPGKKPDFPSQGSLWSQVSLPTSTSSSPQRPIQFLIRQSTRSRSRSRSPHLRRQRIPMPPPFLPSGLFGPRTPSPPPTPKRGRKQMADLARGAQVAAANADANTNVNVRAGARTPSPYSSSRSSSPRRCVSYLDYEDSRASSPREEHQQESRKGYNPFLRTRSEILLSPSNYVSLPRMPPPPAIRRTCISKSRTPSPSYSAANEIAGGDSYSPSPPPLLPHPPQPVVIVIPETRSPSYAYSDDGATPKPFSPEYVPNRIPSPQYIAQNETDENDDDDDNVDDDDGRRSDTSRGLVDAPIPNIPRWLTDWSKSAVKDSRSIHAPPKRSRPPLPPVPTEVGSNGGGAWQNGDSVPLFQPYPSQPQPQPQRAPAPLAPQNRIQAQARAQDQTQTGASKAEGTPQFALRSDGMAHMSRNDYYASAFPSSWPTIPPYASPPPPAPSTTTSTLESPVRATAIRVPVNNSNNNGFGMQTSHFHQPANVQRMSHFFNTPNSGQSTTRSGSVSGSNRDIANSYGSGPMPNPLYTSSTLPKDRTSALPPPPPPPSWSELVPPQRRLRFAPLPPTPGSDTRRGSGPPPVIPHFHNTIYCAPPPPPMPPQPSNYTGVGVGNMNMYTYQAPTPRPVVPPVVIPIPPAPSFSTPSVTGAPRVQHSTLNMNLFGTNGYPANKKYCFSDATVVFRVENCLYKVHRHFFELHSPHLRQLLRPYYFSFNNHIFLSDVKKVEFERLLSIFYPSDLTKPDINTVSGWTSMLELSSKWSMAQIKALAIQKLIPLTTAVEKIALAKKHNLSSADPENAEWLVPAYTELCARRSPLTLEEAEDLDLPTIIKVWEVQNAIVGLNCMYSNYGEKVAELVKEKFEFRGAAGMHGTTISGFWSSCS